MSPEEFRRLGHAFVDWIADHRERLPSLPVRSSNKPGGVLAQLPSSPPIKGPGLQNILSDIDRTIVPGLTQWLHPNFYGYFPGNAHLSSVLADMLATGLGVNVFSWETSPAATELEERMLDWLRQMIELPTDFQGVIQDTASTGSLSALLCARELATDYGMHRGGLAGAVQRLCVYASEEAHSSVQKAALLAGFGKDNLRWISTDDSFAMRADQLSHQIQEDLTKGFRPAAIVATSGTTSTTAFDPIEPIAALAKQHGIWLHVDAAMAGSGMILPELRHLWRGVYDADSVLLNPHKWLGTALDLSVYYTRKPNVLQAVMATSPAYLQSYADGAVKNYRDWGVPLGRRFRALKLWFLLLDEGVEGLQQRLRRDLANAQRMAALVQAHKDWRLVAPVHLQTLCVVHQPEQAGDKHWTQAQIDAHNKRWCDALNESARAYLTSTVVHGRRIVRVSIGSEATEWEHVKQLWTWMQEVAENEWLKEDLNSVT